MEIRRFSALILGAMAGYHQPRFPLECEKATVFIDEASSSVTTEESLSSNSLAEEKMPLVPSGKRVLIVGDSLGVGFSPPLTKILRDNNYEAHSHTILGSTTKQWISLIKQDLVKYTPDLVIVSLGTNDSVASQDWLERNKEVFSKFVKLVDASGSKLVWVGPPDFKRKLLERSSIVRQYIMEASPLFYDSRNIAIPMPEDGIHSTQEGYGVWAFSIWSWMLDRNIVAEKIKTN